MTSEDRILVIAHVTEIAKRAEEGDQFCIKTLGVMVLMGCYVEPPDDDGGGLDVPLSDNVIQLYRKTA